jgi:hypothetical protein
MYPEEATRYMSPGSKNFRIIGIIDGKPAFREEGATRWKTENKTETGITGGSWR